MEIPPIRENLESSTEFTSDLAEQRVKSYRAAISKNRFGFPKRFWDKCLENFKGHQQKVKMCKDAVIDSKSVFLTGKYGTGKTHLAIGLSYVWYAQNIQLISDFDYGIHDRKTDYFCFPFEPVFLPSVEFFLQLKNSFNKDGISEMDIVNKYSDVSFLIIDDIGAEKVSDWSRQMFYTLIDRRYRDMKQTVITSNMDLEELANLIDGRISSRIVEMGEVVKLEGDDARLKK